MKIGLIELSAHSEVLDSLVRQVIDLGVRPTVYTTAFCADSSAAVSSAETESYVCPPGLPHADFLAECEESIRAQDHVLVVTPVDALCALVSGRKGTGPEFHCLVHNFNTFTRPDDSRPSAAIARLVLKGAAQVLLPDLRLVRSGDPLRTHALNIAYPQYAPVPHARDEVRCCVPGRIYGGRNYAEVLSALELALPRLTRPLRVDFLGEYAEEEPGPAVGAVARKVAPRVELRDHAGYVPQEEFDRTLAQADFLIVPVADSITRNGVVEVRGQTCVTGNTNDMVRFGLPALMPAFYPLSDHVDPMTARYSDASSLAELIVAWVDTGEFNHRKQRAAVGLEAYRAECLSALRAELART